MIILANLYSWECYHQIFADETVDSVDAISGSQICVVLMANGGALWTEGDQDVNIIWMHGRKE